MGKMRKGQEEIPLLAMFTVISLIYIWIILPWLRTIIGAPFTVDVIFKMKYYPTVTDHALISLLMVEEPKTGKNIGDLLGYAVAQGKKKPEVNGKVVDLDKLINEHIEFMLPNLEYHLKVSSLDFGKKDLKELQKSSTDITLPNLRTRGVTLSIG